jgi:hypothetical protein
VILGLIDQITEKDENGLIQFMKSQLCLSLQHKNKREYGTDFVIFCSLLLFISHHAYNFVRKRSALIMPHPNTLKTLCSSLNCSPILEQNPTYFLQYIKEKSHSFEQHEKRM